MRQLTCSIFFVFCRAAFANPAGSAHPATATVVSSPEHSSVWGSGPDLSYMEPFSTRIQDTYAAEAGSIRTNFGLVNYTIEEDLPEPIIENLELDNDDPVACPSHDCAICSSLKNMAKNMDPHENYELKLNTKEIEQANSFAEYLATPLNFLGHFPNKNTFPKRFPTLDTPRDRMREEKIAKEFREHVLKITESSLQNIANISVFKLGWDDLNVLLGSHKHPRLSLQSSLSTMPVSGLKIMEKMLSDLIILKRKIKQAMRSLQKVYNVTSSEIQQQYNIWEKVSTFDLAGLYWKSKHHRKQKKKNGTFGYAIVNMFKASAWSLSIDLQISFIRQRIHNLAHVAAKVLKSSKLNGESKFIRVSLKPDWRLYNLNPFEALSVEGKSIQISEPNCVRRLLAGSVLPLPKSTQPVEEIKKRWAVDVERYTLWMSRFPPGDNRPWMNSDLLKMQESLLSFLKEQIKLLGSQFVDRSRPPVVPWFLSPLEEHSENKAPVIPEQKETLATAMDSNPAASTMANPMATPAHESPASSMSTTKEMEDGKIILNAMMLVASLLNKRNDRIISVDEDALKIKVFKLI